MEYISKKVAAYGQFVLVLSIDHSRTVHNVQSSSTLFMVPTKEQ